jgi:4-diphosphocytidyl-2-C-methyl-D-erythritol kinase
MTTLTERACAKINLTLTVHGKRPDGYHALESLVAFADVGDTLTLDPGMPFSLRVTGPFAAAIDGENLIEKAVAILRPLEPRLAFGAFVLEKKLPVAAGIGGGSADAAAALRLIQRANPTGSKSIDWHAVAASLGADVPVCLASKPVVMRGTGGDLSDILLLPPLHAVLVNARTPRVTNKTAQVFRTLAASPVPSAITPVLSPPWPTAPDGWLALMARHGNDLEAAASEVLPEIKAVKLALGSQPGFEAIRLSGAGPTCFATYPDAALASAARIVIAAKHPDWWVVAATIG